jgi:hypothetical protein
VKGAPHIKKRWCSGSSGPFTDALPQPSPVDTEAGTAHIPEPRIILRPCHSSGPTSFPTSSALPALGSPALIELLFFSGIAGCVVTIVLSWYSIVKEEFKFDD